jgi:two-component system, response regulator
MQEKYILLVEDNVADQQLTIRAFKKNQILNKIILANDGEEALEYLFAENRFADRDINELPALILLDLKLPRVDGLEVLKQVRANQHTKLLPVVLLTSSREEQDMARGYSLGANSYIRKPLDFEQFVSAVQNLGQYWLILNETPPAA